MARSSGSLAKIVVFRALQLGDMLCAVPALRALRAGYPEAEIVLVGLPWARGFVDRFAALLDGFREFPGDPGLPEREPDIGALPAFFESIHAEHFDLALQLHGSGSISNKIVARFGAKIMMGFHEAGQQPPPGGEFIPYPSRGLEIRRLLRLVEHLGIPSRGEELEFPISEEDRCDVRGLLASHGVGPLYACIHAGASVPERRWPVDRFAAIGDALAERGFEIVLTGTAAESELAREAACKMRARAINLTGATPLGTLAALLESASLLICNDTGVSHMAAATRTPSVVISTGDNPDRWAPIDARLHRVLCREQGVTVHEVLAQAEELLTCGTIPGGGQ